MKKIQILFLLTISIINISCTLGTEQKYNMTEVDTIEIKVLPKSVVMESSSESNSYFDEGNNLFRPLFQYLQSNDLAMTTPVEAEIENPKMRFFIESSKENEIFENNANVKIIEIPERKVLSIGIRGSYNESNFQEGRTKLLKWLQSNPEYKQAGKPYAVYWNSPFMPSFLKRAEVHIPIDKK